jgi:hypothetical protein
MVGSAQDDRPDPEHHRNWERATLGATLIGLLIAIWAGLDAHWADDKIIAALTQDLQSTQKLLDTSQAEKAAVESVSLEAFLKQYKAHVGALNAAVAAYDEAAKVAAAKGLIVGSALAPGDTAGALAGARNDLYAATDKFTHFVTIWRAVAEPFNKLLDGNATQLENSRREDNAADVSAAVHRIVSAAPDLATPLRVALDKLKAAPSKQ